jgi:hypothetical protein
MNGDRHNAAFSVDRRQQLLNVHDLRLHLNEKQRAGRR